MKPQLHSYAAIARRQSCFAFRRKTFTSHSAHKTFAAKHIAFGFAVGTAAHSIVRAGGLRSRRQAVNQAGGGHFVRHAASAPMMLPQVNTFFKKSGQTGVCEANGTTSALMAAASK
ncbi:hypothetical protein [Neisseria iguanae]|uniref:hypothetical protein n=1 Tax=Neisseria iguanae TaxID=90242 RepID=UPI001FE793C6|nr:hypothetical protein [Neisseria iguanae]